MRGEFMEMQPTQDEVNRFLDEVREEGMLNMFGAYPYVADMFGLDALTARKMTCEWMRTFGERHPS
jgi:hypothetical protein